MAKMIRATGPAPARLWDTSAPPPRVAPAAVAAAVGVDAAGETLAGSPDPITLSAVRQELLAHLRFARYLAARAATEPARRLASRGT